MMWGLLPLNDTKPPHHASKGCSQKLKHSFGTTFLVHKNFRIFVFLVFPIFLAGKALSHITGFAGTSRPISGHRRAENFPLLKLKTV